MYICGACEERLDPMEATCPHCGYEPGEIVKDVAAVLGVFGLILLIPMPPAGVFGLILAILLFGYSFLRTPAQRVA